MKISDEARELVNHVVFEIYGAELKYGGLARKAGNFKSVVQTALNAAYNRGLEDAVKFARDFADKAGVSWQKATDAGRENIASHRQSDIETALTIAATIQAMKVKP